MSAGDVMADGSPVTPELDARLLADLREWRARFTPAGSEEERSAAAPWSMRLTIDELDMLLRRCDELDMLKRELVDMPDEKTPPPVRVVEIPAGHAMIAGEIVELA